MFSSMFSKNQATIIINESVDTSSHSSFEEIHIINNNKASDNITDILQEVNTNEKQTNTNITIYKVASNAEEEEYEEEADNIEMFNPFLKNLEDILLKLSEKHESLDQELGQLTKTSKTNNLKQYALNEILKTVSGLQSHRYNSEDAIISATLIINNALDRILTIFENNHYKYLNSFRKRTENFSLNVNNTGVLNNLQSIDKEMLNRMVEKLILEGQKDYSDPCLFYTNPTNDRFFMARDKKIVSILKTLSEFVRDLLSLIPDLVFKEEAEVVITPEAIIDAQIDMIFEPIETPAAKDSTRRKSKRRGGN
ncbi:MAG: hypothetical protein WCI04_01725 [archaeon]